MIVCSSLQASDITGGVYIRVPEPASLLQFMLVHSLEYFIAFYILHAILVVQWGFLPGMSTREHLATPSSLEIDYRASCCCHQRLVDVGFVCSVCLSSKGAFFFFFFATSFISIHCCIFYFSLLPVCSNMFQMPVSM